MAEGRRTWGKVRRLPSGRYQAPTSSAVPAGSTLAVAELAGVTRMTATRALTALEQEGIVTWRGTSKRYPRTPQAEADVRWKSRLRPGASVTCRLAVCVVWVCCCPELVDAAAELVGVFEWYQVGGAV